jgi:hypothetical protein
MEQIPPGQTAALMKRFSFRGGRLLSLRLARRKTAQLLLRVKTHGGESVRLKLRFDDIIEYRFQQRPFRAPPPLSEVRLGYFEGSFYLNLDAWADEGVPQLMDFRNSEAFIAGARLSWEIVPPRAPKTDTTN